MVLALMADPHLIPGLPNGVLLMLVSAALMAVGLVWLYRMLGTDELMAAASWRYRDRGRLSRIRRVVDSLLAWQAPEQTLRWWITRFEFAFAHAALALATVFLLGPVTIGSYFDSADPRIAVSLIGYAGILFGIWWMRRMYLSPLRDAEPRRSWRYRDR